MQLVKYGVLTRKIVKFKFPENREFSKFPGREIWLRNTSGIPGIGIPDIGIDFTKCNITPGQ